MKGQKLSIKINKPVKDVFAFTINPNNTPKWIDSIVTEQINEWPPKLGTMYRNQNIAGEWRELKMTAFEQENMFVLSDSNGFHVGYTFIQLDANTTELEYSLWMDKGDLKIMVTKETLEKLKQIIETKS